MQRVRKLTRKLNNMNMPQEEDPDAFVTNVYKLKDELESMGGNISEERFTDLVRRGSTDDHKQMEYNAEGDPDFSLAQIETIIRTIYVNSLARGKSERN